jgi:hypothetical protein
MQNEFGDEEQYKGGWVLSILPFWRGLSTNRVTFFVHGINKECGEKLAGLWV